MKHGEGMHEGYTDEETVRCVTQKITIVTVVEHPVWGKGKPVHGPSNTR